VRSFELQARGPFSLAASRRFLEGFAPAAYAGQAGQHLDLAFPVEGDWRTVAVRIVQPSAGAVHVETAGEADLDAVRVQVERMLSLDVDASDFPTVGLRDPVVARLQQRYAGLRPVGFSSPYDAAAWALISHRLRITQAAAVKAEMARQLGAAVNLHGRVLHAFPAPARLAGLEGFPGLFGRKPEWLRALGRAALEGRLDAASLRSVAPQQALAELLALPGLGPFSADLVLLRGAGSSRLGSGPREPALARCPARVRAEGDAEVSHLAEAWRPYRTWVCLLLRTKLEEETHEIADQARRLRHADHPRSPVQ